MTATANKSDLTAEAREGFAARDFEPPAKNPYLPTSNSWAAWQIGEWLRVHRGSFQPVHDVRASRGYTYHASGMKFAVNASGTVRPI